MSVDATIREALLPLVSDLEANIYTGSALEWCTWNYAELPVIFADSRPDAVRYIVQVHWFLPRGVNPISKKKLIKNALFNAGLTYPSVTNATAKDGQQHYVFECEFIDGGV